MQTRTEPQPKRRGRKGPWQYQPTLAQGDGADTSAPGQAQRAFAAGAAGCAR